MRTTDITEENFDSSSLEAKQAAETGPVFINNGKKRTHVLLSDDQYQFIMRMVFLSLTPEVKRNLEYKLRVTEF